MHTLYSVKRRYRFYSYKQAAYKLVTLICYIRRENKIFVPIIFIFHACWAINVWYVFCIYAMIFIATMKINFDFWYPSVCGIQIGEAIFYHQAVPQALNTLWPSLLTKTIVFPALKHKSISPLNHALCVAQIKIKCYPSASANRWKDFTHPFVKWLTCLCVPHDNRNKK